MKKSDPVDPFEKLIRNVRMRLAEGEQIRRTLPGWGRLAMDRPLPFLCVYRRPLKSRDNASFRLVTSEASYLISSPNRKNREGIAGLVGAVAENMGREYGRFLILEIWPGPHPTVEGPAGAGIQPPAITLLAPREEGTEGLTDQFEEALRKIRVYKTKAKVTVVEKARRWPPGMKSMAPVPPEGSPKCLVYGLEISPVYLDPETGEPFPHVLRVFRRGLSIALRRFFYAFAQSHTRADPEHFHSLGRRAMVKAVWETDRILAETSESYEFLLQLTPVNGERAWSRFEGSRFQKVPAFHYRPQPADPVVLKRNLFKAPVERIEDPSLALIFRQKIEEVDRQITMLQDRNTPDFLPESIQLFGEVNDDLHELAVQILEGIPARSREAASGTSLDAEAFAQRAREEIAYLKQGRSEVSARVEVRPDVTGLLVSSGNLLVSSGTRIPSSRVEALLQHEVGTHVLTYHNGKAQKLRLLSAGFAGYDALQEGLAVLAEYLVGGLSRPRLRLLAGRVAAARCLLDGATFIDTFRVLRGTYGFAARTAFTITVRTYRSGGLTKDSVYLLGLKQVLEYVGKKGEIEPLYVGKIALEHVPIVLELTWRNVLIPPPMIPRFLNRPEAIARLDKLRQGVSVLDLLKG